MMRNSPSNVSELYDPFSIQLLMTFACKWKGLIDQCFQNKKNGEKIDNGIELMYDLWWKTCMINARGKKATSLYIKKITIFVHHKRNIDHRFS